MNSRFYKLLNINYPQNYIIRSPLTGALLISVFCFGFSAIYKPSDFHASGVLSYEATMAVYALVVGLSVILLVKLLKIIRWFADADNWTLSKELAFIFLVLFGTGTAVFLSGFILESGGHRLNFPTFLNSFKNVFSVGIIPFAFFTSVNYSYFFSRNIKYPGDKKIPAPFPGDTAEDPVRICSQLKKEEVIFYPSQLIYAESDGNYVIFYFSNNNQIKKQIIRNSITSIEKQLSDIPFILRTHRSFIVNLKKVRSKQGNILGYKLKITDSEIRIPVSRNRIKIFDMQYAKYKIN